MTRCRHCADAIRSNCRSVLPVPPLSPSVPRQGSRKETARETTRGQCCCNSEVTVMPRLFKRKGNVVIMDRRHPHAFDGKCEMCGKQDELRPYGPNNENICFDCAMK